MSSPFHEGEREVQDRAGVCEKADRIARIITGKLTDKARVYLATTQFVVLATLDGSGQPWASLLTGPEGFPQIADDRTIALVPENPLDPILSSNLRTNPEAGMLGMDLSARRRLRVNGEATLDPDGRRLTIRAREVFGNCPKYIQAREALPRGGGSVPTAILRRPSRGEELATRVRAADTFFIASHSTGSGADASHRGGMPGFVRVSPGEGSTKVGMLAWDDYAGNNLFQTLGNVHLDPRVGLLFVDFEDGSILQVAGEAEISWDHPNAKGGTGRSVLVRVRKSFLTENATPRRWRLREFSPHNLEP